MTSKKHEVDTPNVWFPSRLADDVILIRYINRSHYVEITGMGDSWRLGDFRISLADFLKGLGIRLDDCAAALDTQP